MSTTAISKKNNQTLPETIERVLVMGDLSGLKPEERINYYTAYCQSVGLNPLTRPLEYITLNGKLQLYAKRECTDQLRKLYGVSIVELDDKMVADVHVVTAKAVDKDGRTDCSKGAVSIANLKGVDLANALMKAETKAKRRVTLSICGLGILDESEIEDAQSYIPEKPTSTKSENMDVKCAQCGGINGHTGDCPTLNPKTTKPEKKSEGKVLEPEKPKAPEVKTLKGWMYVESATKKETKAKVAFGEFKCLDRPTGKKYTIYTFHKTILDNIQHLSGKDKTGGVDALLEFVSKQSASEPAKINWILEKVHAHDAGAGQGEVKWIDNQPVEDDLSNHGVVDAFDEEPEVAP